jgi:hypothetical protein
VPAGSQKQFARFAVYDCASLSAVATLVMHPPPPATTSTCHGQAEIVMPLIDLI